MENSPDSSSSSSSSVEEKEEEEGRGERVKKVPRNSLEGTEEAEIEEGRWRKRRRRRRTVFPLLTFSSPSSSLLSLLVRFRLGREGGLARRPEPHGRNRKREKREKGRNGRRAITGSGKRRGRRRGRRGTDSCVRERESLSLVPPPGSSFRQDWPTVEFISRPVVSDGSGSNIPPSQHGFFFKDGQGDLSRSH